MQEYFCDELNNVLSCFHDRIMSCCTGKIGPVYIEEYDGGKIDWDKFKQTKINALSNLNSDNIDKTSCCGCHYLREKKDSDEVSPVFNLINISHWTHCNCGCIYCARMLYSEGSINTKVTKSQYYDMLPLIKDLYKQNLLDKENLTVNIQGGDISVLKEFPDIVKEFLKHGVNNFQIFSNNIIYQPIIRKLLEMKKVSFLTSLDSGCAETYLKLKRVNKFNDSVKNLRKYSKGFSYPNITVKYIVIENINDNKEEIYKFIKLMADIGIKRIEFMIDNKYVLFTDLDKVPLPAHYGDLYLYTKNLCAENNIDLTLWPQTEYVLKKYALKCI